jgi:hypothetical protein
MHVRQIIYQVVLARMADTSDCQIVDCDAVALWNCGCCGLWLAWLIWFKVSRMVCPVHCLVVLNTVQYWCQVLYVRFVKCAISLQRQV